MFSSLRNLAFRRSRAIPQRWLSPATASATGGEMLAANKLLELGEVEKTLRDVKADDICVIPVTDSWTDYMVVATGRSTWHVRNIAQALVHKIKQKQKGNDRLLLPSVEGHEGGKWIVIDSGSIIVHALDEKARSYYNLERLWTAEMSPKGPDQTPCKNSVESTDDTCLYRFWQVLKMTERKELTGLKELEKTIVKVRRKNNSKKPASA